MPISFQVRRAGDVVVMACDGRLVEGPEAASLQELVGRLLPDEPCIVLDVARVEFLDSSGLGLLVRLLHRSRAARGDLKLCAVPDKVREILRITKLAAVFDCHAADTEAIAAFYLPTAPAGASYSLNAEILCVEASADVLACVCEPLRQSGYGVVAANNLPDALALLRGARPKAVIISASLRAARNTWTAVTFNTVANAVPVIELPADFSGQDAGEAGRRLLEQVRAAIGSRAAATPTAGGQ